MTAVLEQVTPTSPRDAVNRRILEVSEDQIRGFVRNPIAEIARQSGVDRRTVIERIRAMLSAGTIRRVRQTLLATNLAQGALVAWKIDRSRVDAAFDFIARNVPQLKYIQIDDGYQPAMGDWLETGAAFGGNVQRVLKEIRKRGFEPAIWVAPFIAEAGVPGYHIEDQKPGAKKCGHQGGKVLVPEDEQIKRLNAARFQLDVMRVPGIIVARTDAEAATLLAPGMATWATRSAVVEEKISTRFIARLASKTSWCEGS